ncbi:TVP38/TMEM64 family protein [Acanthopleuribacter pedis]|uniref:VTT domain-containing protein n=1 Tax=Acanthopleuribacter pedis TaxID=442870 RepID=A0A8J7QBT5_9BACT|nr:VTT domain-containing protein [Acanthopleuribacter pedis]MBO1318086.1 VTT domain-containing protein [Acanthopleuribacter pedis]
MRPLLKIMLMLFLFFTAMLLVLKFTGILTVDNIQAWLAHADTVAPLYVGLLVILLLFADLFVAVPTLTIMILAGHFLGPVAGAAVAITGSALAAFTGYTLAYLKGEPLVALLIKDQKERDSAKETFLEYGVIMILLARALPVLPEVTACLAGLTRMPLLKFTAAWSLSCVPYAVIATYAGSISSLANPMPAIFTAIGLATLFGTAWLIFSRTKLSRDRRSAFN